ncbi:hypothetical protein ABZ297_20320 [Nonomuraea sp. NPDC005983]|uniref:hypothetical protein n=1 Tax=Nonomuraea sp. NPDC005983 TaxID=3155595 RepID=UPI0033A35FFC
MAGIHARSCLRGSEAGARDGLGEVVDVEEGGKSSTAEVSVAVLAVAAQWGGGTRIATFLAQGRGTFTTGPAAYTPA